MGIRSIPVLRLKYCEYMPAICGFDLLTYLILLYLTVKGGIDPILLKCRSGTFYHNIEAVGPSSLSRRSNYFCI